MELVTLLTRLRRSSRSGILFVPVIPAHDLRPLAPGGFSD